MYFFVDASPAPLRVPVEYPSGQGPDSRQGGEGRRGAGGGLLQAYRDRRQAPQPIRTRPMAPPAARELLRALEAAQPGLCGGELVDAMTGEALAERYFRALGIELMHTRTALGDMIAINFELLLLGGVGALVPATEWWDPSQLTYTQTSPLTATSPFGPAASNPLRAWDGKILGSRFSLAANGGNPNAGMPRHHTPTDGTGIGGWHSVEFWDGGNWLTCTSPELMELANGHTLIIVFRHFGAGAVLVNNQTLWSWRGVEPAVGDEGLHRMRRTAGQWATERRATGTGGGAVSSAPFGASDTAWHIRTDILEGGLLTQRLDSVVVGEGIVLDDAPVSVTKIHLGNSNMSGRQGANLNAFVGDAILAPPGYSYALREAVLREVYGG